PDAGGVPHSRRPPRHVGTWRPRLRQRITRPGRRVRAAMGRRENTARRNDPNARVTPNACGRSLPAGFRTLGGPGYRANDSGVEATRGEVDGWAGTRQGVPQNWELGGPVEMARVDLFSKRQKRKRGEVPEVYVYDQVPKGLRVQIVQL